MRRALLVLTLLLVAGVAPAADGTDATMPESETIGPYRLAPVAEGVEIRSGASLGLRGALGIAAALCIAAAVVVTGLVPSGVPGLLLGSVGLALAAIASLVPPGADTVRASEAGLVVRGFVGRQGTTAADAIGAIEVRRRTPTGAELKRERHPRVWQVTVRDRGGEETVVRFRLASRQDASRLAERLGAVLGRPVVQREGLAR